MSMHSKHTFNGLNNYTQTAAATFLLNDFISLIHFKVEMGTRINTVSRN